jgi:uncharacterized protein YggE
MKRRIRIIAALFCASIPFVTHADDMKPGVISVRGEAVIRVAPDLVMLSVTVREEDPKLAHAKEKHDRKLNSLLGLAAKLGIPKSAIQTSYTETSPVYDYQTSAISTTTRPTLRGYQVQTTLEFRITDFSLLGDFMSGVTEAGIDQMGSVNYSLQNESNLKENTLVSALQNAHDKAARLAATANVTLGAPLQIQEEGAEIASPVMPHSMAPRAMLMSAASVPQPELPAGLVELRQSVAVSYQIK